MTLAVAGSADASAGLLPAACRLSPASAGTGRSYEGLHARIYTALDRRRYHVDITIQFCVV
jgi:hypothetical protein